MDNNVVNNDNTLENNNSVEVLGNENSIDDTSVVDENTITNGIETRQEDNEGSIVDANAQANEFESQQEDYTNESFTSNETQLTNEQPNINQQQEPKYEEVEVKYQEVAIKPKEVRTDSYFDGGVLELLGWKILAGAITGISAGLGAPWGKCMVYKYEIGHTVYNGKRLKFEGNGGDLFVNRFKWFFFTIITLGIYAWFVPVKKAKWVISNIHFEDEEHVPEESFFDGSTLQLIGVNILCRIIKYMSLGILAPFATCYRLKWINKHTVINRKKLAFTGKGINLLGKHLLWGLLTIITFGIYGFWRNVNILKWEAKNTHIKQVGEVEEKTNILLIVGLLMVAIAAFAIIATAVFMALIPNYSFNSDYTMKETYYGNKYCESGYYYSIDNNWCYRMDKSLSQEECTVQGGQMLYHNNEYVCHFTMSPNGDVSIHSGIGLFTGKNTVRRKADIDYRMIEEQTMQNEVR